MEKVYVVYGYDYQAKKETSFTLDKRNITPFICRVFSRLEDVEKYVFDYYNEHVTDDVVLNMSKSKNGYFSANMTGRHENNGVIYGTVIEAQVSDVTEEIGDSNLFDDIFSIFNG